ncbi:MAG: histidine phosphatase family protein [Bacteroidia bacterium]|nr:histidine phosphatase family protein [Bacteroidia bacterium]MDW8236454.1 histidine phosphatase family protein [Bacteroidia bacterium]
MCQFYFFLRHAATEDRTHLLGQSRNPSLSEEGRKQAQRWQAVLSSIPFQVVVSSPAARAQETAEIIRAPSVPLLTLPEFHEINWGSWEGYARSEAEPLLAEQRRRWTAGDSGWKPPHGESLQEIIDRITTGLAQIITSYQTGSLLIVSHGGLLRVILCYLLGYPWAETHRFYHQEAQLSWLVRIPAGHFYVRRLAVDADTTF